MGDDNNIPLNYNKDSAKVVKFYTQRSWTLHYNPITIRSPTQGYHCLYTIAIYLVSWACKVEVGDPVTADQCLFHLRVCRDLAGNFRKLAIAIALQSA